MAPDRTAIPPLALSTNTGGELTHSYSVESNNEVKMMKQEIISMIQRAGFEAVERDTVYNRVEEIAA
jgi:2-iminoacetate synthase ThiH